jgi:hypothetical protein
LIAVALQARPGPVSSGMGAVAMSACLRAIWHGMPVAHADHMSMQMFQAARYGFTQVQVKQLLLR